MVVALWGVATADSETRAGGGDEVLTVRVSFAAAAAADAKGRRILNLGGLILRAWCIDYGEGRKYLAVGSKSTVDNTSRAVVFSRRRAGQAETYAFKASDVDANDDWYDFLGTNPYGTRGTLSYSRPDGGQVSLTFAADQDTPDADCVFSGQARFAR